MKRIPIQLTLWSPRCRAMKQHPDRRTVLIHLGKECIGYGIGGFLTVFGLPGDYKIS